MVRRRSASFALKQNCNYDGLAIRNRNAARQDVGCLRNMGGVLCIRFGRTGVPIDPVKLFVNTKASEHCSGPARAF
jgi:hypothetical protein